MEHCGLHPHAVGFADTSHKGEGGRYIRTRSAFGSYIGFSDASAAIRSPAISIS